MQSLYLIIFIFLFSPNSYAENICYYPKGCDIISSEFSTGGGEKSFYIMEIDCKNSDGSITKYIDVEFTTGGFFGFGRVTMPRKVLFKMHDKDELECDY